MWMCDYFPSFHDVLYIHHEFWKTDCISRHPIARARFRIYEPLEKPVPATDHTNPADQRTVPPVGRSRLLFSFDLRSLLFYFADTSAGRGRFFSRRIDLWCIRDHQFRPVQKLGSLFVGGRYTLGWGFVRDSDVANL